MAAVTAALLAAASCGAPVRGGGDPAGGSEGDPTPVNSPCETETYEIPATWDCSEEIMAQLRADNRALGPLLDARARASTALADATATLSSQSCEAGVASTRAALRDLAQLQLLSSRSALLRQRCFAQYFSRTKGTCEPRRAADENAAEYVGSNASVDMAEDTPEQGGASQFSTTNNQVAGVDEADIVKNDASFVYTLRGDALAGTVSAQQRTSADFTELLIFSVWPAQQAHEVSRTRIEGKALGLQLSGDRLLAYSSVASRPYYSWAGECTYGYSCVPRGDGGGTLLTVFDVSDRSAPREVQRIRLDSSYLSSRRIGEYVYTVSYEPLRLPQALRITPQPLPITPEAALAAYAELERSNREWIDGATPESFLPELALESGPGATAGQQSCGAIYQAAGTTTNAFLSVVSLDLMHEAPPQRTTLIAPPGFTYASSDALYLAVTGVNPASHAEASAIHKFELAGLEARYVASGTVPGHVLNQFSLDARGDVLRVATTTGRVPSPAVFSTLTVLAPGQQGLITLGSVSEIAPGEDLRAVRFAEDRAYVVTFKKTDPLFVIDLAEPSQPRVLGELHIPGFSTYLHPLDDGHLLSIGYDADDQGSFAWFQGVQLQIFDVSDMSSPQLLHKEVIGTRGSSSEALTNHLAFTYFAPKHWLALPITICEGGGGSNYGDDMTFSGLYLYDVSIESGFQLLGGVAHPPADGYQSHGGALCSNWWSDASSEVKRSIIMDDDVLSLSERELKINAASDLATDLVVLPIE